MSSRNAQRDPRQAVQAAPASAETSIDTANDRPPRPPRRAWQMCPWCGYDLAGLPEGGRCPECGERMPRRPRPPAEPPPTPEQLERWKQERASEGVLSLPGAIVAFALVGAAMAPFAGPFALISTVASAVLYTAAWRVWCKHVRGSKTMILTGVMVGVCALVTLAILVARLLRI